VELMTTGEAIEALLAGRHVLTVQPASVAEAEALHDAWRRSGQVAAVAQPGRFQPMITAAARAVRTGRVGLPWNVQADCLGADADPIGVIDALVGLEVMRVHAVDARGVTLLSLDHEKGLTSTITVGDVVGDPVHRYRISGTHGTLLIDATGQANTAMLDDLHRAITTGSQAACGPVEALRTARVTEARTQSLASGSPVLI
jgi:predicted dehydrogenase